MLRTLRIEISSARLANAALKLGPIVLGLLLASSCARQPLSSDVFVGTDGCVGSGDATVYELQRDLVVENGAIESHEGVTYLHYPDRCIVIASDVWNQEGGRIDGIWHGLRDHGRDELYSGGDGGDTLQLAEAWIVEHAALSDIELFMGLFLGERLLQLSEDGRVVVGERVVSTLEPADFWNRFISRGLTQMECAGGSLTALYVAENNCDNGTWIATRQDGQHSEDATSLIVERIDLLLGQLADDALSEWAASSAMREIASLTCAPERDGDAEFVSVIETRVEEAVEHCVEEMLASAGCEEL